MDSGNAALIERFYAAFDRSDGDAMAACYAPDARFSDPVFGELTGAEAGSMWRMLTRGSRDLHVELAAHDADAERGSAHWIATYTFSQTGRPVVNDVRASFRFGDGLFTEHVDRFGFWAWSRQALGTNGLLLGWTPFLRTKVGRGAREGLDKYIAREARRAV
jgi:ketosteroid isomerase-like protein